MARIFELEHPENHDLIAKCGYEQDRGFCVAVFDEDRLKASLFDDQMLRALEFLVERGFFSATDLKSAHEMIFGGLTSPIPEGPKRALEAVVNFLRVAAE